MGHRRITTTCTRFDHFFGFYTHAISYSTFIYSTPKDCGCNTQRYDFHDDGRDFTELTSQIASDDDINSMYLYRDRIIENIQSEAHSSLDGEDNPFFMYLPLQSPHGPLDIVKSYHSQCKELMNENADIHTLKYCEIMMLSDDVIGDIVKELKQNHLWSHTVFILTTDNGGDIENGASNYPHRGTKGSLFEGNQRVISLIGGGAIPKEQHGTEREALFSALDWTPTLLRFAGIYNEIEKEDRTWDGIVQYDLIMNGDEGINGNGRDHVVLNVGLRNLESAAVIFKHDDQLFKYIALNSDVDVLNRGNGWSVIDEENKQIMFVSDDIEENPDTKDAQAVDDKYLFNLIEDVAEEHNLLLGDDEDEKDELIAYAKGLFDAYLEHPLYSENIKGLWNYLEEEDMTDEGVLFTDPWMSEEEYFEYVTMCIEKQRHFSPVPDALLELYTKPWVAPKHKESKKQGNKRHSQLHGLIQLMNEGSASFELYAVGMTAVVAVLMIYAAVNQCILKKNEKNLDGTAASSYGSV